MKTEAQHTAIWLPTGFEINPNTWLGLNTPQQGTGVIFVLMKQGQQPLRKNRVTSIPKYIFQSLIDSIVFDNRVYLESYLMTVQGTTAVDQMAI